MLGKGSEIPPTGSELEEEVEVGKGWDEAGVIGVKRREGEEKEEKKKRRRKIVEKIRVGQGRVRNMEQGREKTT